MEGCKVFIVSGEASGDLHGSNLIKALKGTHPAITFIGMGGDRMREAGLNGLDIKSISVVGVAEVIKRFNELLDVYRELKSRLDTERPDVAVFIDFPDFNLRLAKEARRLHIPVVYYISPQVWAWRKGRLKRIARLVDKMLVIFPFEVPLYEMENVDVEYVGHPLSDIVACELSTAEARDELGLSGGPVVALLPGSRVEEVERLLPLMVESAAILREKIRGISFLLPVAESLDMEVVDRLLDGVDLPVKPVRGRLYEILKASDAAIITSGTATLEAALMLVPMVIVYKLSAASYMIGRLLVDVRDVGLPNIIAGRRIVNEFIQEKARPESLANEILDILHDGERRSKMVEDLRLVRDRLGTGGASERAAASVLKILKEKRGIC